MPGSSTAQIVQPDTTAHRLRDAFSRVAMSKTELRTECTRHVSSYNQLIERLSREIDETVLARALGLYSEDNLAATLVISNRRLTRLEIDGDKVEVDCDGDPAPEDAARAFALALRKLCARSDVMTLRVVGRAPHASSSAMACSAAHLAQFNDDVSFENQLKSFLKNIHADSRGWIFWPEDGPPVAHDPDPDLLDNLKALDQKAQAQAHDNRQLSRLKTTSPICSAFAMGEDMHVLIASASKDRLVAAMPQSKLHFALQQWQRVFCLTKPQDH